MILVLVWFIILYIDRFHLLITTKKIKQVLVPDGTNIYFGKTSYSIVFYTEFSFDPLFILHLTEFINSELPTVIVL